MKSAIHTSAVLALLTLLNLSAFGQGTAFTYQGSLNDGGVPANGSYDLRFALFDAASAGAAQGNALTNLATAVSNGLFTVTLDFGNQFPGANRWLEIAVRTNGNGAFSTLSPRQSLTPTPYAITAGGVISGGVTAVMLASGAVTGDKISAGAITGIQIDDGGNAAYERFLREAESVGGDHAVAFGNLSPVVSTNVGTAAFSFTLGGSPFGTVLGFSGTEAISQPYTYAIEVQSTGAPLNPDNQLGLNAQLTYTRNSRSTLFGGVVTACTLATSNGATLTYLFRLSPTLAALAMGTNYRVTQSQTAATVAAQVYLNATGNAVSSSLATTYPVHDQLIQYGETDLNFFNRILEFEGIFYCFNHSANPAGLILGDSPAAYLSAPNSPFVYSGDGNPNHPPGTEYIQKFQNAKHQSTLVSVVSAYNFTNPAALQTAMVSGAAGVSSNFEFGVSSIPTTAYNQLIAQARQDRQTAMRSLRAGAGTAADLRAGYAFTLNDQTSAGLGGSYVVTAVQHAGFVRVTNGVSTLYYGNQFQALPAALTYRPPLTTPKSQAQPGIAVVTGPATEEIYTDSYGRVKVQFKWDRAGTNDQNSSAWVRLSSPWAGKNRGMVFLPRIGDEVLIAFLQGDPDQPVITGSLYNANNLPPWELPANQTQSGFYTRSVKGGTYANANGLRFEDKKGSEQLWLHAEKNMDVETENDVTFWAGHDSTETVDHDFTFHVKHDETVTVDNNVTLTTGVNLTSLVGGSHTLSVGNNFSTTVGGGLSLDVGNAFSATANTLSLAAVADATLSAGNNLSITVGNSLGLLAPGGVGVGTTTPQGLLELQGGADSGGNSDLRSLALAYRFGGYRHWLRTRHNSNAALGNAIDFFVNTGSTSTASTAPGINNVLGLTVDAGNGGSVGIGTASPQANLHVYSLNNPTVVRVQSSGTPGFGRLEFVSNPQGDINEWRPGFIQSVDAGSFTGGLAFYANGSGVANKFGVNEIMRLQNGRVGIGTTTPVSTLQVNGTVTATAFNPPSDRNLKEHFAPVSPREVLEKVAGLAISRWNFIGDEATPHVGPMAQDFHAAFGLGTDDKHIATVDADGVALAAIQGLNEKLEQTRAENLVLKERLEKLEQMITQNRK